MKNIFRFVLSNFGIVSILFSTQISNEKIYAIMITGKDAFHKKLAEQSIASFNRQTYPNRQLIIVNDGNYSLATHTNKDIIEIRVDNKKTLGALRNIGLSYIPHNSLYMQWDDDDWHHEQLMNTQYQELIKHNADVCVLKNQVQYAFKANAAWTVKRNYIEGTILCRKKNNIKYPEVARSEDSIFLDKYRKKYMVHHWDNPEHYYLRFIHGHNTWDDAHFALQNKKENQWLISAAAQHYLNQVLQHYS